MSPVLIQNLPVVNEASFEFLAVKQPVYHLKVGRPPCGGYTPCWNPSGLHLSGSIRPGFGRPKRLCIRVTIAGVAAVAGHFSPVLYTNVTLSGLIGPRLLPLWGKHTLSPALLGQVAPWTSRQRVKLYLQTRKSTWKRWQQAADHRPSNKSQGALFDTLLIHWHRSGWSQSHLANTNSNVSHYGS